MTRSWYSKGSVCLVIIVLNSKKQYNRNISFPIAMHFFHLVKETLYKGEIVALVSNL